ncbi:MAG: winged helix-turn-helix domain-containing protein [Acetobacteraceae bacterium]|nr:winged helix-turn-helix domain-containing protein [Acetobacteraceae bacterium]
MFVSGLARPQGASAVTICKLRKKLAQAGADNVIGTVWGRGYMMRDPAAKAQPAAALVAAAKAQPVLARAA